MTTGSQAGSLGCGARGGGSHAENISCFPRLG
eukprot:CAMPEP_0184720778 /NCGR_PEP_ID=MMETSP0314-20130426/15336_1 /TAXON_ID=38298 /ORGANISM="Rhodella maculata, Strain CCMP 736" /LENGTH=31 /DNA_ID= /DNA_START= /DNA_END= /DNA_ORIENTATION=